MRARYLYLIALVVVILDQGAKLSVIRYLGMNSSTPIGSLLSISVFGNAGGAFGMLQSWAGLLIVVSAVFVVAVMLFVRRRTARPASLMVALALMLGGGVGNLIDRVRWGHVIDFIDVHFWPVFNLADVAITAGVCFLAYYLFSGERRKSPAVPPGERKD